jgi:uncharacterized protein
MHAKRFVLVCFWVAILPIVGPIGCSSNRPPVSTDLRIWSGFAGTFAKDLADRYNTTIPGITAGFQQNRSMAVVSAIQAGQADMGLAQADMVYIAYRHGIDKAAYPHTNLRGIAVMWVNNVYVVVRADSPIFSISDLRGKRVGLLAKGSAGEFISPIVLSAYAMTYDDVQAVFQSGALNTTALRDRTIDAFVQVNPVLTEPMKELDREVGLRLLPFDRDAINKLRARYPFLKRVIITRRDFPTQKGQVDTVGADSVLVCRKDLDEQMVYDLTKQLFLAVPHLVQSDPELAMIDETYASAFPIPLHPGAARYYREREILK